MPRFVIHIGPHKTATTYLQQSFKKMSGLLRKQSIVFPARWCATPGNPSHVRFYEMLRDGNAEELKRDLDQIRQSDPETILISSEGLANLPTPAVKLLRECLEDAPVEIIFYCRRWSELLPSTWQTLVKQGSDTPFPVYAAGVLARSISTLNYSVVLDRYSEVFGHEALSLVSYSNLVDEGEDIAAHFLTRFLGCTDLSPLKKGVDRWKGKPNASLNVIDTEILRALNAISRRERGKGEDAVRRNFMTQRESLDLASLRAAIKEHVRILPFPEDKHMLKKLHQAIVRDYGDRMVEPKKAGRLFAPKRGEIQFVSSDYLFAPGAMQALMEAYRQLIALRPTAKPAEEKLVALPD